MPSCRGQGKLYLFLPSLFYVYFLALLLYWFHVSSFFQKKKFFIFCFVPLYVCLIFCLFLYVRRTVRFRGTEITLREATVKRKDRNAIEEEENNFYWAAEQWKVIVLHFP
jgi:uncharacterized membrane protein